MNADHPVRLAFIGCGGHATHNLYPALNLIPDVDLWAVCDLKGELAERNARRFGARRWYSDFQKMLDEEEVEGVLIVGPPQMHVEVGLEVLKRGLPIFVEKPSAIDSGAAKQLAEAADRAGTFGMVAFMKRFAAVYRMGKHLCEQEGFGGLQVVEAKFAQGPYPAIWGLMSPALSFLTGQVVHIFDLIRFFGGDVAEVYAAYREAAPEKFVFLVNVAFKSGAVGALNLSSLDMRPPWRDFEERVTLTGNEHLVVMEDMLYLRYHAAREWLEVPGLDIGKARCEWRPTGPSALKSEFLLGYQGEIEHFARCAREQRRPRPDLWDGVKALKIAEAVRESSRKRTAIRVEPEE